MPQVEKGQIMDLEVRISRLERQLGRWKRVAWAGGLLLVIAIAMGQAAAPIAATVTAKKFTLVDDQGKTKAVLAVEDEGPIFVLHNQAGKPVVQLQVPKIPDKPSLYFLDAEGRQQMELALTPGGPVLHFSDQSGVRARIATNELNAPLAAIYDDAGKKLFEVTTQKQ